MTTDVPSPADVERNGEVVASTPWQSALFEAVRALEARVERAERERDDLAVANRRLRRDLALARERLENWKLRQQAWVRHRRELERRLGD